MSRRLSPKILHNVALQRRRLSSKEYAMSRRLSPKILHIIGMYSAK